MWHTLSADQVLSIQAVTELDGLSSAEAASRAERFGPNKFAEAKTEPRWRAFLRQYYDTMQIVLLVAGILSLYPLKELGTGLLLLFLTLFNAVLGLRQEGQAAAAVAALQKMMIIKAKVTRDGQLVEIPAEQLVPGDVVSVEAGDIIPADGGCCGRRRWKSRRPRSPARACRSSRAPTASRDPRPRWGTAPTWCT